MKSSADGQGIIYMSNREAIRRYLLGTAPQEERSALENRYLSDSSLFEEMTEAENDLIDAYVRGKLSITDRQEFERSYLSSERGQTKVQFASALSLVAREEQTALPLETLGFFEKFSLSFRQRGLSLRGAVSFGVIAIALAVGWVQFSHYRAMQARLPKTSSKPAEQNLPPATEPAPSTQNAPAETLAQNSAPRLQEFTVELTPGLVRSSGDESKSFPRPQAPWVRLRLTLEDDGRGPFSVSVETVEGRLVQRIDGLAGRSLSGKRVVDVRISSRLISSGDYIVRLSEKTADGSDEELDSYTFRVLP